MVQGIRLSTRPDYIDEERLHLLKKYGVTTIELGAQSADDDVLCQSARGHTSWDIEHGLPDDHFKRLPAWSADDDRPARRYAGKSHLGLQKRSSSSALLKRGSTRCW